MTNLEERHIQEMSEVKESLKKEKMENEQLVSEINQNIKQLNGDLENDDTKGDVKAARMELECPVCLEEMCPPTSIWQCSTGHVLCQTCRYKVKTCPSCRKRFMG